MTLKPFTVALFVVLVGWSMFACGPQPISSVSEETGAERKVSATEFKFKPGDQTFTAGQKYKIIMVNQGAVDHTWVLTDPGGKELVKLEAKVGKQGNVEFTAPASGTYNIICDVAGHKEAGMQARATIQ